MSRGGYGNSRFLNNANDIGCNMGNIRYKYVEMPPLATGINLNLENLGSSAAIVWYTDEVTLTIRKKGCGSKQQSSECGENGGDLVYDADTIDMDNAQVGFLFDDEFWKLCRGRYEAIITVGCNELSCRLDFCIGQKICVDDIEVSSISEIDARSYPSPDCCEEDCEAPPKGCITQRHNVCGDSIPCCPEKVEIDYRVSDKEVAGIEAWMAERNGSCRPEPDARTRCEFQGDGICDSMELTCEDLSLVKKGV